LSKKQRKNGESAFKKHIIDLSVEIYGLSVAITVLQNRVPPLLPFYPTAFSRVALIFRIFAQCKIDAAEYD